MSTDKRDEMSDDEIAMRKFLKQPVYYTHLALPTILLV